MALKGGDGFGRRDNHFLDCRAYNLALLEYLGFSKLTADDWSNLARERGAPAGERLPLWAPTAGTRASPPAEATTYLTPVGEAGSAPADRISIEQIEQIQRAVEARGAKLLERGH